MLIALPIALGSCTLVSAVASGPENGVRYIAHLLDSSNPVDPVAVQEDLLRFADDFISTESVAISEYVATGGHMDRYKEVKMKLAYATDMMTLATGSNPLADLVNVVVYMSTLKDRLQEHWTRANARVPGTPVLHAIASAERDIWTIAGRWLSPEQVTELSASIKKQKAPLTDEDRHNGIFASISLVNDILTQTSYSGSQGSGSLFSLLDLDPLAGLDPAARELSQTRLFGERTLFVGKHMPQLVEWQAELLSLRTLKNPSITSLIEDANSLTETSNRIGTTLEKFPETLAAERKAIFEELHRETPELKAVSAEITRTFEEGQRMAESINSVIAKLEEYRSLPEDGSNSSSLADYTNFLEHLESSLKTINELHAALDRASQNKDQLAVYKEISQQLGGQITQAGEALVDHAFRKLMILITYCFVMIAGAIYLTARLNRSTYSIKRDRL